MNARGSEVSSPTADSGSPPGSRVLAARDLRLLTACGVFTVGAGVLATVGAGPLLPFAVSAVALALLATLVGRAVDALGDRLGAGATGVVQSALGNLPELFVCIFALQAGLYDVVRAAIVGSVLSNVLLVLGLAFVAGGLKHARQKFSTERSRTLALMLVLAVFALAVPTLTDALHTPAAGHEGALSVVTAVVLLVLFGVSLPAAVAKDGQEPEKRVRHATAQAANVEQWPLALAIGLLAAGRDTPNRTSSTTAVTTDKAPSWPAAGVCSAPVSVGTASAKTARTSISASVRDRSVENFCRPCLRPPATNARPRTRRTLDRTDPTMAARTTSYRPARRAKMHTKSSGRSPSADWTTPVAPAPRRSPSASTARPTRVASSARATALTAKGSSGPAPTVANTPAPTVNTPHAVSSLRSRAAKTLEPGGDPESAVGLETSLPRAFMAAL